MSDLPPRNKFEQYKALRDKGDYRAAAKILLPYKDNPKVKKLIGELREAHKSGEQTADEKPVRKTAAKAKSKSGWRKRLLFAIAGIIGLCGAIYATYLVWYYVTDQEGQAEVFTKELDLWRICFDLYYEDYFVEESRDAFSDGCFKEARSMLGIWADEIDYCWQGASKGNLERQFINCLVDNDVSMSDTYIILAMATATAEAATNP